MTRWSPGGAGGGLDRAVATRTTGPDGTYDFANLPPSRYRVTVTPPEGLSVTTPVGLAAPVRAGQGVDTADIGLASPTPVPFDVEVSKMAEGSPVSGGEMTLLSP